MIQLKFINFISAVLFIKRIVMKMVLNWIIIIFFVSLVQAQEEIPFREEFRVNTYTSRIQNYPQITLLSDGDFVISWWREGHNAPGCVFSGQLFSVYGRRIGDEFLASTNFNPYGSEHPIISSLNNGGFIILWIRRKPGTIRANIFGQLFSAKAEKIGNEFQINTLPVVYYFEPFIIAHKEGGFIVCWTRYIDEQYNYQSDISGQLFSAIGDKIGEEFRVNTHTEGYQYDPQMALLKERFVTCWTSIPKNSADDYDIYGQLFLNDTEKTGKEFLINTYVKGEQRNPRIASLPNGNFLVCWESVNQDGSNVGIYAQLFSASGEKSGSEFQVNTHTNDSQFDPQITVLSNEYIVIIWTSINQDGSGSGIYGQLLSHDAKKVSKEFKVNTYIMNNQNKPRITALKNDKFVICWDSFAQDGDNSGIFARIFSAQAEKLGMEFQVNTYTSSEQFNPEIIALLDGGFVICWTSSGQDGEQTGIYAKRFSAPPAQPFLHELKPFSLIEPDNDSTINTTTATLIWQQPSNHFAYYPYELQFKILYDEFPDFSSPQIVETDRDTTLILENLQPGITYFWKVLVKNISGDSLWSSNTNAFFVQHTATGVNASEKHQPENIALHHNYPNPFNPSTTIHYEIPSNGTVCLKIYDLTGRLVKTLVQKVQNAGAYTIKWDGTDFNGNTVAAGIYIYKMEFTSASGERFVQSKKMSFVK